ncbi:MAG: hypothetical protein IIB56_12775 [Planctomycetes bacterium]|nr:hypothetical protein [Planctomycetota bacterium]
MTRRIFCKVLLVVVAIFGLFVLSGVLSAQGSSENAFERVKDVQERNTDVLMARPGVVGTAVGFNDDGQYAVLVLLERPGVAGIPQDLDGVPVQVVVTGKIIALSHATDRFPRPVPIGVSTGHPDITAGTIACRVKDGDGNVYALSNNHVYANQNEASLGDAVIQPGTFDGGSLPDDEIGTLADFVPIDFSRRARNEIDAAIALSDTDRLGNATPSDDGYGTPSSTIVTENLLYLGVQKYGRTTGLTHGDITGVNATVNVGYGPGKTAKFVKQIIIEPGGFSAGGDSGSLIVTDDGNRNPVGLLFAGSSSITVANRIDLVLDRFGVTVDGVDGEAVPSNDPPTVTITSPVDGSTFASGATISFAGTATDTEDDNATLTAALAWTSSRDGSIGSGGSFSATLSDGNHTITASVTDSGGKTGSDSISITVGTPPAEATTVSVVSIDYATEGGKNKDKHLLITVALLDNLGDPVAGASVSIDLFRDGSPAGSGSGTTGSGGTVTFTLKNAKSGCYTTTVTDVTSGLTWDPDDTANVSSEFCK